MVARTRLRHVYKERFPESRRERLFLASVGFFTTVVVIRALTFAIHHDIGPFHDVSVSMRGRHIHHLVWGILLLLLVGYAWLVEVGSGAANSSRWMGRLTSMVYGVAAALTLDEFALWLNLRDVYWEREGRESFEAMAAFGGLLAMGVIRSPVFSRDRDGAFWEEQNDARRLAVQHVPQANGKRRCDDARGNGFAQMEPGSHVVLADSDNHRGNERRDRPIPKAARPWLNGVEHESILSTGARKERRFT